MIRKPLTHTCTSVLQTPSYIGFKQGYSTTLCTGILKTVVDCYIKRSSKVYACLIDASKAFDTVDHFVLFKKLLERDTYSCANCKISSALVS